MAKKGASAVKKPRQAELPGTVAPKDRALAGLCKDLAGVREDKNDLAATEKQLLGRALARMQATGRTSYTSHGVELLRSTTDKLRVRLVDDDNVDDAAGVLPVAEADADDTEDAGA